MLLFALYCYFDRHVFYYLVQEPNKVRKSTNSCIALSNDYFASFESFGARVSSRFVFHSSVTKSL